LQREPQDHEVITVTPVDDLTAAGQWPVGFDGLLGKHDSPISVCAAGPERVPQPREADVQLSLQHTAACPIRREHHHRRGAPSVPPAADRSGESANDVIDGTAAPHPAL
jgi:hypothetical protein